MGKAGYDYYDVVVIGGGFYGCTTALQLKDYCSRVLLIEKEPALMKRASYVNQARIHQGYHYPRSILTSVRSRVNFSLFVEKYRDCVYSEFDNYYAIGKISSKVSASQFKEFCRRIKAPIWRAPKVVKSYFNKDLIEAVFRVREYAFDAAKLAQMMETDLRQAEVDVWCGSSVSRVYSDKGRLTIDVETSDSELSVVCVDVYNCTYSQINRLLDASNLDTIPLKHELTEMALVEMPEALSRIGVTVMDGLFFSVVPFPARGLHSLTHVRYTPHCFWQDGGKRQYTNGESYLSSERKESQHVHMLKDAQRYVPALSECRYVESLWEVKTVLPQSEVDDSRPILFKCSERLPNVISVMGGKIDNVFDVQDRIRSKYRQ